MKTHILVTLLSLTVAFLVVSCSGTSLKTSRWYASEQVAMGKPLYATYCAGCHGTNGGGASNWSTPLPSGSYPPQPLNGSGHSWHHSLSQLKGTIANGGTHPGATMPGFADSLSDEEQKAVIAAFQSFWDDKTYKGWLGRGGLDN